MKTIVFFLIAFLAMSSLPYAAAAQQQPKQAVTNDMQSMIESIKKDIANLEKQIADAKKRNRGGTVQDLERELDTRRKTLSMMEGAMKSMDKVTDKELKKAAEAGERIVPQKDTARIARVPKTILTDAELKALLLKTHAAIEKKIAPKVRTVAQDVYQAVKKKYSSATAVANAANGGWIIGGSEMALWLMGKACTEDANPDNLNNYAAFLVMAGAEEAALPILMKLNQKFPDNSTILNNIGQAWFGLGDLEQSEKHLDGAIRFFALHSQANYTKCLIEESRGNKTGAINALTKSIQQAYTTEKANKLRKLGGKLTDKDIAWNFRMPQDPLGLHKFIVPRYAKNVDEAEVLDPEWQKFIDDCWKRLDELKVQEKNAESEVQRVVRERDKLIKEHEQFVMGKMTTTEAIGRHQVDTLNRASTLGMALSPLGQKALKKSQLSAQEGHYMRERAKNDAKLKQTKKDIELLKKQLRQRIDEISTKYAERYGEGKDNPEEQECREKEEVRSKFLASANTMLERVQADVLTTEMREINEDTYWKQFMQDDATFQLTKNRAKQRFLNVLLGLRHEGPHGGTGTRWVPGQTYSCKRKGEGKPAGGKLADFDDIHCDHDITLNMIFVKGEFTCNKAKFELDATIKGLGIHYEKLENLNTGEYIRGTVEVGFSKGLGDKTFGGKYGPLAAELKGAIGGFVELDSSGVTDLGLKGGVKMEVGTDIYDKTIILDDGSKYNPPIPGDHSVTVFGVEARYGWNSGGSLKGKGILSGIDIK